MKKIISLTSIDESTSCILFDLPDEKFKPIINDALKRLGQLTCSGRLVSIDKRNNEIEIELDNHSSHPEIITLIKIVIDILKRTHSTNTNINDKKNINEFIQDLLLKLVNRHGKENVINHIKTIENQTKGKHLTKQDYSKLILLIEPRDINYILKYMSLSLKLNQYSQGVRFCTQELKKDYCGNLKTMIKLYQIFFKLLLPDNGHSETNKKFIIQIFDLIKNDDTTFLDALDSNPIPFLIDHLTILMEKNLSPFIINNEADTAFEIITTLISKITAFKNQSKSLSTNLEMLIPFISLTKDSRIHQHILTTFLAHKTHLTDSFWTQLKYVDLENSEDTTNNFIKTLTSNFCFNDTLPLSALIALAALSTSEDQCDKLLEKILKHPIESHHLDLLSIFTKYQSTKIEKQFETITYRSTPYGHIIWLINKIKQTNTNTHVSYYLQTIEYSLNHVCKGGPFKRNDIFPSLEPIARDTIYSIKFNQLPFEILDQFLNGSSKSKIEWVKKQPELDITEHFAQISTPCKTNKVHQLYIQNHSDTHIYGHTCDLKNSKSKSKKTQFLKSILSKDNLSLIEDAWLTFDPNEFDKKLKRGATFNRACYWRVEFDFPLSEEHDYILTLQVSIIDEGVYSVHIHPSNNGENKVDSPFPIVNNVKKKQRTF